MWEDEPSGNLLSVIQGRMTGETLLSTHLQGQGQLFPEAGLLGAQALQVLLQHSPLLAGLLPEQLTFPLHLGPQEAQPFPVPLLQMSARHTQNMSCWVPRDPPGPY